MTQSLRASAIKLATATTVVLLAAGGAAASVAAAAPHSAASHRVPPPVSHQLCYRTSVAGSHIPPNVTLINQFSTFKPTIGAGQVLCNPVTKKVVGGETFPATNPRAHLVCYKITEPTQPTPTVDVANQFGTARLIPRQPNLLCLPSWKSLVGVPQTTKPQPPGLNHFTCYPVSVKSGAYHVPAIQLKDEFTSQPVSATVNPVPAELCLPTEKIVGTHHFPMIDPATHLLCFPVTPTPIKNAWYKNQFGFGNLGIRQTNWLCLPSTKTVVP